MIKIKTILQPFPRLFCHRHLSIANKPKYLNKVEAWQIHNYGDLNELQLSQMRTPIITDPDQILIKVEATSLNPIDKAMIGGYGRRIFNVFRENNLEFPLTLGRDFCGEIVEKGHNVAKNYQLGDKVYGFIPLHKQGTHSQFALVDQKHVCHKPKHLNHVEAASIPYAAMTAYGGLYVAGGLIMKDVSKCQILVLGASGGVGTMAVQLLKAQQAKVVGTCSADALPLVKSLGADNVFDYHEANHKSEVAAGGRYDVILDCCKFGIENLPKSWKYTNFVTLNSPLLVKTDEQGLMLGLMTSAGNFLSSNMLNIWEGKSVRWGFFVPSTSGFQFIDKLVKRQRIKPVIHKVFNFHELPKGLKLLSSGHLRGKIVVDFEKD